MADAPAARGLDGGLTIIAVETPSLGDRSYLVHDGDVAFVVDPQRDIDRFLDLLDAQGVRLTHVFETHLHNDYLTGGLALCERTGATYLLNAADQVAFARTGLRDGDVVSVGDQMHVTALATPGHTFTHLSFVLTERRGDRRVAVFTGGSLLFGATGRPDLLGVEHRETLARHQHASAHRLARSLADDVEVFPTHGFGSFCAANQSDATASTIGQERSANPALTRDEDSYVEELLAGLGAYPAYYAHMSPGNASGPGAPDLSEPQRADAADIRRRIDDGEWVVDLRHRTIFAAGHAPGTFNFGLDGSLATYLGWLIEWGTPVTLLGETPEAVAEAQRDLARIGIERPAAAATGGPEDWSDRPLASFACATFADLASTRHHRTVHVLDVRRDDEFAAGRLEGALNIPIHELPHRLADVPDGEVWVHCRSGYRASVAASFLDAYGRHVVAIDDEFDNAAAAGLPLVRPSAT